MKCQPNRNYISNDKVMTPKPLARALVQYFRPSGRGLEPCRGTGNIWQFLVNADWCEIDEGLDFFNYSNNVDYIFTNPPWSQIREFMNHSMEIADEIYFLLTINHVWTKARLRDIKKAGFGLREICIFDSPKTFPQMGFQLGMVHLSRGYCGDIKLGELQYENN